MNVTEAMRQIEGLEFAAYVGIASSLKVFLRQVASNDAVRSLLAQMDESETRDAVLGRLLELTKVEADEGFEHPADAALATYLWLLAEKSTDRVQQAADAIRMAKMVHWATHVADKVAPARAPVRRAV